MNEKLNNKQTATPAATTPSAETRTAAAAKRFCAAFALVFFLLTPALCGLLWAYDPLGIFHAPFGRQAGFNDEMRLQSRAIIERYDFDSYIIGTSMLRNTRASEAGAKLGGKWVNISLDGGAFNERAVVLDYLLRTRGAKRVITTLDGHRWAGEGDTRGFAFLYDDNAFNDIKAYLNGETIWCALRWSSARACVGEAELDGLMNWMAQTAHLFGGFENWLAHEHDKSAWQVVPTIKKLREIARRWDAGGAVGANSDAAGANSGAAGANSNLARNGAADAAQTNSNFDVGFSKNNGTENNNANSRAAGANSNLAHNAAQHFAPTAATPATHATPATTAAATPDIRASQQMLEKHLLRFIRAYPQTQFELIFPTYSRLSYALDAADGGGDFARTRAVLRWLVGELAGLANARIYALDTLDYADDIANYKDAPHYAEDFNSVQLDAIARGEFLLTPQNVDAYFAQMAAKIAAFDIAPFVEMVRGR